MGEKNIRTFEFFPRRTCSAFWRILAQERTPTRQAQLLQTLSILIQNIDASRGSTSSCPTTTSTS